MSRHTFSTVLHRDLDTLTTSFEGELKPNSHFLPDFVALLNLRQDFPLPTEHN